MSKYDDLVDTIDTLSDRIESVKEMADYGEDNLSNELEEMREEFENEFHTLRAEMKEIRKVLCLVEEPDPEALAKYSTLRNAYKEYEFVKRLTLGNE